MNAHQENNLKATGSLSITLTDQSGKVKETRTVKNLIVTVGKNLIASRLKGDVTGANAPMSHMAVGTDATAPVAANTTLGVEVGRVALASLTVTNNTVTHSAVFPAGTGTGALVEAGIFNSSTAGTMLCRTSFDPVNKAISDSLTISWNVTVN